MLTAPTSRKVMARRAFTIFWILGVVQSTLLGNNVGRSPAIRYGLGVPLVVIVVASATAWALFARKERGELRAA